MNSDTFSSYHPIVNMTFFVVVIGFSMFLMHPIILGFSLVSSFVYTLCLNGKKAVRVGLVFVLPMFLLTAILNPLFNHRGATILAYLPNGNPITLESVVYGIAASVMLVSVVSWFSCFNAIMTGDKFVYLFGRIAPALSLILAMSLRLVPRFITQAKIIGQAQRGIGRNVSDGNLLTRARHGIRILSILTTWALENAIETADSMKSRGYGLPGRTAFSIFRFSKRDGRAMAYIVGSAIVVMAGAVLDVYSFRYFPTIAHNAGEFHGAWAVLVFAVFSTLCLFPIIVKLEWKRGAVKWKVSP